jgi:predicted  nucleic acid-binding Zn-ribbon protein
MKICHECRVKLGHKRKDKGAHTAILCKCDECGRIKSILPARHWVEGK